VIEFEQSTRDKISEYESSPNDEQSQAISGMSENGISTNISYNYL